MMMPGFSFTPADLLLIPAILFSLWAQWAVKSAYAKYSQIGTRSGMTGASAAHDPDGVILGSVPVAHGMTPRVQALRPSGSGTLAL